jgi:hypothetical protein
MLARILYRTRQFWHAVQAAPALPHLDQARSFLSPELARLFEAMTRDEQAHSLTVFHRLLEEGETHPDLLTAALLHDAGKSRSPLRLWERVAIVLVRALFPIKAAAWGSLEESGPGLKKEGRIAAALKKPFRVAAHHPAWGAEMAQYAGASPLAVSLIRRHQDVLPEYAWSPEDLLLRRLQNADNES